MGRVKEKEKYLSQEELKILAKVSNDVFYFSTFCWVVNPVHGRVKFDLYPFQRAVLYPSAELLRSPQNTPPWR